MYKDEVALNQYLSDAFINNPKTVDRILSLAVNEIEHLKKTYVHHDWLKPFPVIAERLEAIRVNILARYSDSVSAMGRGTIKPLVWTGGVAVLGTLFNELRTSEKNSAGNTMINATAKEIEDFICEAFVDESGNPFERSSVNRYLSSDKQAKRNKVDIKAIKAKTKE
ncbi:hypothetical protein [Filimonas effusa]|uniref:Uncharacterized protein n=1 Tax=Filimonas effusa TaxID=2508721 RepID=A0A4Q1DA75_9BACT|nr:hypothetical protein [Filimonas effusa]RXK86140.1 hypothetical protein ESB13_04840 [Filimonas effusa]